jgi:hypothetical protein
MILSKQKLNTIYPKKIPTKHNADEDFDAIGKTYGFL